MCEPLASDGVEFADDGIGPALSFDHLKALALDHLGGSPEGNDVVVVAWLPPSGAASSALGRDGESPAASLVRTCPPQATAIALTTADRRYR